MMKLPKILLLSDLHLERMHRIGQKSGDDIIQEINESLPRRNKPIIVLAGDIHQGTQGISWAKRINAPVIYVPGNHEFWDTDYTDTILALKRESENSNVHVLLNESVEIKGIKFIGALLWTDLGTKLNWKTNQAFSYASSIMNDYSTIRCESWYESNENIEKLQAAMESWQAEYYISKKYWNPLIQVEEHEKALAFIESELEYSKREKLVSVVVTHHVPFYESLYQTGWSRHISFVERYESGFETYNDRYYFECMKHRVPQKDNLLVFLNYASDLFSNNNPTIGPDMWLHGHCHEPVNYVKSGTHVYSSPTRACISVNNLLSLDLPAVIPLAIHTMQSSELNTFATCAERIHELLTVFDKTTNLHRDGIVDDEYYKQSLKLIQSTLQQLDLIQQASCLTILKNVLPGLYIGLNINHYKDEELLSISGVLDIEKNKRLTRFGFESKFDFHPSHKLFVAEVHKYSSADIAVYQTHVVKEYAIGGDHYIGWRTELEYCREQYLLNQEALHEWLQNIIKFNA